MKIIEPKNQRSCRVKEAGTGSVIDYVDFSTSCVRTCLVGKREDDIYNVMDVDTGEIFKIGADMGVIHYANAALCLDMEEINRIKYMVCCPMCDNERCKSCKKDWTKCGTCPVMMQWVKEQREKNMKRKKKNE